eukprot:5744648-Ditylum_brightwellii.AAC.1
MLDFEIEGIPLHKKLLSNINIIDTKPAVFTKTKGIWIIEPTKENVAEAIKKDKVVLEELTMVCLVEKQDCQYRVGGCLGECKGFLVAFAKGPKD